MEIADCEFEAIQKEDASLRANARTLIDRGRLNEVEITPDALRSYLDVWLGSDDRISDFTYDWTTKFLRSSGFQDLGRLDECISGLDDDKLSRVVLGGRGGQVSRFEVLLIASMGENFIKGHPWGELNNQALFVASKTCFEKRELLLGSYQPKKPE